MPGRKKSKSKMWLLMPESVHYKKNRSFPTIHKRNTKASGAVPPINRDQLLKQLSMTGKATV